jgi:mono/diheme cytochrome c family protein
MESAGFFRTPVKDMNDQAISKRQPVVSCGRLLLPVIALLFTACGPPIGQSASKLSASTPPASQSGPSATPKAAQAVDNSSGKPEQFALRASADATRGEQLFNTFQPAAGIACATCHRVDSEERLVGPGLLNVGNRAQSRVSGLSAVAYLRQSIVNPGAYVVAGYADLMPKNWGQIFSEAQIDDLIAYLFTLKGR